MKEWTGLIVLLGRRHQWEHGGVRIRSVAPVQEITHPGIRTLERQFKRRAGGNDTLLCFVEHDDPVGYAVDGRQFM